ncbi:unnamed protein product, partial [Ixodes hexagonus]
RKLAKSYQPKKKDDEENGYTSSKAFCLMLNEINDIAGQHELISENLTSSINKELSTLIKELKDERKKLLSEGSKLQTSLQNSCTALDKSKKHYEKMFKEAEKASESYVKADADLNLSRVDLEKAKQNAMARSKACEDSKTDYANQLQKTNQLQRQHYNELMPRVFEQLQTLDERRTVSIQGYMKKVADIHRQVLPIVGKCLDGIVLAADSIDAKKDAQVVIERYKSGFLPADDFPFEDLSVTKNCDSSSTTGSTLTAYRGDTVRGTLSAGRKKRSGLFGIFSSNKHNIEEFKDDYSELPPNQRRKKLMQEIEKTKAQIHTLTQARLGSKQMRHSSTHHNQARPTARDFESSQERQNFNNEYFKAHQNKHRKNTPPNFKKNKHRKHVTLLIILLCSLRSCCGDANCVCLPLSVACRPESGLGTSHTSIPDEDFEENGYEVDSFEAELLPALGRALAMYPFDAQSEGSIPMEEGEEFLVVEVDQGDGWTRVRRENLEEGFVPTSYLEVTMFNSC